MRKRFQVCAIATIVVGFILGCGRDEPCDLPRQEPPDPASGIHLFDGTAATWTNDPPTSGPHRAVSPPGGIHNKPIPRVDQVAFLEAGGVILHHIPNIAFRQLTKLRTLASSEVAVSPNLALDPKYPVMATAWTWRLRCNSVDAEELIRFVTRHTEAGGRPH